MAAQPGIAVIVDEGDGGFKAEKFFAWSEMSDKWSGFTKTSSFTGGDFLKEGQWKGGPCDRVRVRIRSAYCPFSTM